MKFDLTLKDLTSDELLSVMQSLSGDAEGVAVKAAPAPEEADAAAAAEIVEAAEAKPEPKAETEEEEVNPESIIAQMDATRKRTQTATTANGTTVAEGDTVHDEEGEIAVVAATYRGYVVVNYEDNTEAALKAAAVTKLDDPKTDPVTRAPQNHAPKAAGEAEAVERQRAQNLHVEPTRTELQTIAEKVMTDVGVQPLLKTLQAVTGVKRLSQVADDKVADAYDALELMLDGLEAKSA